VALASAEPSFVALTVAVFVYDAQLANTVALVMCTDADAPGARSPKLQCSVPAVMSQPVTGGAIVHAMPAPYVRAYVS
jgi:hypothetical protein